MKAILVIREYDNFSRILATKGFEVVNLPVIKVKSLNELSDFDEKLKTVEKYDGIFLTSKNAAQILAQKLEALNLAFTGKVYVLGKRSFEILRAKNLNLVFFEEANTSEEMLEKISKTELKNKNFLFVRGEKSLAAIPNFLTELAAVDETIVYKNEPILLELKTVSEICESIEKSEIKAACFFSPSGAESFINQFGAEVLHQTIIATIGTTTAEYFERRNLKVGFVSSKSDAENFANELANFLGKEF